MHTRSATSFFLNQKHKKKNFSKSSLEDFLHSRLEYCDATTHGLIKDTALKQWSYSVNITFSWRVNVTFLTHLLFNNYVIIKINEDAATVQLSIK